MNETVAVKLSLPRSTYLALKQAAEKARRTESDFMLEAIRAYLEQLARIDPLLGLFANEPEMVDQVVQQAMQSRERTPWRSNEAASG